MKFRSKATFVEAVQFTEAMARAHLFDKVPLPSALQLSRANYHRETRTIFSASFRVWNADQATAIEFGDWMVTDANGRHRVMKADAFAAEYERAAAPSLDALMQRARRLQATGDSALVGSECRDLALQALEARRPLRRAS